jgi:hypothetical protein
MWESRSVPNLKVKPFIQKMRGFFVYALFANFNSPMSKDTDRYRKLLLCCKICPYMLRENAAS